MKMMMMKLRTRRLFKSGSSSSSSKIGDGGGGKVGNGNCGNYVGEEIEWEVRPGGMLVQKRESTGKGGSSTGDLISVRVRVSMACLSHDISIAATSTFGELKMVLSLVTGLEPRAQRILFKGKEREDGDHLHMVGVKDTDKVLLLEDPACSQGSKEAYKFHGDRSETKSWGAPVTVQLHAIN